MIKLKNVEKYFYKGEEREVHALKNINLEIQKGEFSVLTGSSGCGKTTLLNAIGLLDNISEGEIYLNDKEIAHLSDAQKTQIRLNEMGFVFQAYNLIPVLSVKENIAFIMRLQGFSNLDIDNRVNELAEMLEIKNKLDTLPSLLSGGQQQRVAVARAVATKPKIILADEPTANLDHKNSESLMNMMRQLNEKEGVTILFASHDDYVVELAKRVIHLKDGKIL
ncbi:ABC transporter ATP-binding protein [Sulfurimonas lithotrophica]|uniref:ABC transporter ATP-binding protein n=1 Tax=Sulfurimonas lithotrophica TaxID=2590022 RepID=A0A5P8P219_9BACT|nr:ABC transporter ATP-binding protein [Sulfurimonas lithotrophica]QFR49671.1 ABC transporter ATP-binding protein [Sulfurimonas lithotrophica]